MPIRGGEPGGVRGLPRRKSQATRGGVGTVPGTVLAVDNVLDEVVVDGEHVHGPAAHTKPTQSACAPPPLRDKPAHLIKAMIAIARPPPLLPPLDMSIAMPKSSLLCFYNDAMFVVLSFMLAARLRTL